MGFFGELKQDLSQVAGAEKKKEEAEVKNNAQEKIDLAVNAP